MPALSPDQRSLIGQRIMPGDNKSGRDKISAEEQGAFFDVAQTSRCTAVRS